MLCCLATEQIVEPEFDLQSGVTMLNNIVDNIEQQHNIVQSCFQQLVIYASHSVRTVCYTAKN